MVKQSFIYFGASIITLFVIVLIFILAGIIIGPSFLEYTFYIIPFIMIPSVVLSFMGLKYGRKAHHEVKDLPSLLAIICNSILFACLLIASISLLLFLLLVLSFAG